MWVKDIEAKVKSLGVFSGGPDDKFIDVALLTFHSLVTLGLRPSSRLLDIGCGALRNGFLLINYLDAGKYFGVEPNERMVSRGLEVFVGEKADLKQPQISFDDQFNFTSAFPTADPFDFALARSIFTHTSKDQMDQCLRELSAVMRPGGKFLLSYQEPNRLKLQKEYIGKEWLGKSHEGGKAGIAHFYKKTICELATERGFRENNQFDDVLLSQYQHWLVLERI